jgi:hypothetical protein
MRREAALPDHVRRAIALGQGVPRETPAGRAAEGVRRGAIAEARGRKVPWSGTGWEGTMVRGSNVRIRGRSKLQAAWAEHLEDERRAGNLRLVLEEPISLRLAERTWYRPDFLVLTEDWGIEIHEVKGHWEDDSRAKWKIAAELHRWATFLAITRRGNRRAHCGWSIEQAKVR